MIRSMDGVVSNLSEKALMYEYVSLAIPPLAMASRTVASSPALKTSLGWSQGAGILTFVPKTGRVERHNMTEMTIFLMGVAVCLVKTL